LNGRNRDLARIHTLDQTSTLIISEEENLRDCYFGARFMLAFMNVLYTGAKNSSSCGREIQDEPPLRELWPERLDTYRLSGVCPRCRDSAPSLSYGALLAVHRGDLYHLREYSITKCILPRRCRCFWSNTISRGWLRWRRYQNNQKTPKLPFLRGRPLLSILLPGCS
jgi:hypothetical protein